MSVRVKICGITRREDALGAVGSGADALGFIFYSNSPRYVQPSEAARIRRSLPPFISAVGVFVNEPKDMIRRIVGEVGLSCIQLHGEESPDDCLGFDVPVIKALRIKDASSLLDLPEFPASALLLDTYVAGQLGGTGAVFNWKLATRAKAFGLPIILAGGLTPENVAQAVTEVAPYAVDVSSGVELAPGKKDLAAVRTFVRRAKARDLEAL